MSEHVIVPQNRTDEVLLHHIKMSRVILDDYKANGALTEDMLYGEEAMHSALLGVLKDTFKLYINFTSKIEDGKLVILTDKGEILYREP